MTSYDLERLANTESYCLLAIICEARNCFAENRSGLSKSDFGLESDAADWSILPESLAEATRKCSSVTSQRALPSFVQLAGLGRFRSSDRPLAGNSFLHSSGTTSLDCFRILRMGVDH